jgi:hypothetical protein
MGGYAGLHRHGIAQAIDAALHRMFEQLTPGRGQLRHARRA